RRPDLYDIAAHGFIALEHCELERYYKLLEQFDSNKDERITVECEGVQYSILRWCPHLGGDLREGWLDNGSWVCPRHQWHFELKKRGRCPLSKVTIDAIPIDEMNLKED